MPDCTAPAVETTATTARPLTPDWDARLTLAFADDAGTTRLVERTHFGPLRVQKPLYPEGGAVCHAIVVHPPGGIVGGDGLAVTAHVGPAARAFLTSPGAAKWYKANGKVSRQRVTLTAGEGASVEWLPQESIFFDRAAVELEHSVELAAGASYIGCEIVCLGRRASGESFNSGTIRQRTEIRRAGKLLWWEQGLLAGGGAKLRSPLGMGGYTVCATLIAVTGGAPLVAAELAQLRTGCAALAAAESGAVFGATQMKTLIVVRYLGHDSEVARRVMLAAWQRLRPAMLGRPAPLLRIWHT
jgi:urease accessory protein